jgi:hypothetical protein
MPAGGSRRWRRAPRCSRLRTTGPRPGQWYSARAILLEFQRHTGHDHPNQDVVPRNYWQLLRAPGKSQAEIGLAMQGRPGLAHPLQ